MLKFFKKRPVVISQKDEWNKTLENIIMILRDNSHIAQADWVRQIHGALHRNDTSDFVKKLNSVDMWGGSGAVWEVGMFRSNDDEKEFAKNIVKLVGLMKTDRISHSKARWVARIFRKEFGIQ